MRMYCHFVAREKTGADPGPGGAECHDRSKATSIGNASRRNHWNWSDGIDHGRKERQGRNCATHMAASFPSLSDNNIHTTFYGLPCLLGSAYCVKHRCAASFGSSDEGGRLTPEEGDNRHALLQARVEALFLWELQVQVYGERPAGKGPSFADLPSQCVDVRSP
jgi:hypothetical protein